jgi:hypothetical protein
VADWLQFVPDWVHSVCKKTTVLGKNGLKMVKTGNFTVFCGLDNHCGIMELFAVAACPRGGIQRHNSRQSFMGKYP